MLCPQCTTASTKRERVDDKCPKCGRLFRLAPADTTSISDYEFEKALSQLSSKGAHKFTRAQLVAEIERHLVRHKTKWLETMISAISENTIVPWFIAGAALVVAGIGILTGAIPIVIIALVVAVLCSFYAIGRDSPEVAREKLEAQRTTADFGAASVLVQRYSQVGPIAGLLEQRRWLTEGREKNTREFDLHSFGFDRVIVVQGEDTVEMLVANRFHFEHNAAIVSFSGYPQHVAEIVAKQMKSGHTRAHVFLLHDASTEGYRLAEQWRKSDWAKAAAISRVGLAPRQVPKVLPVHASTGGDVPSWVPTSDAEWLRASSINLSALRPVQTMTLLFNAITEVERRDASTTSDVIVGFDVASDSTYDFG